MSVDWGLAGAVVLSGLVIVFTILIVLIFSVEITSRAIKLRTRNSKAPDAKPAEIKPQNAPASQVPAVQAGIGEETVAAIMAAVSCMADSVTGTQYAVKSITRAKSERPVWGFAGMQQNTRPF